MQNLDRLFEADYLPSDKDMLYARSSTTGIHETQFNLENHIYRMIDVGGQRSERKKWIQAFDDVRAVLFVAAINAYDQYLPEDPAMVRPCTT
jgi:guanine nucleotide-binding protein subunit alpha